MPVMIQVFFEVFLEHKEKITCDTSTPWYRGNVKISELKGRNGPKAKLITIREIKSTFRCKWEELNLFYFFRTPKILQLGALYMESLNRRCEWKTYAVLLQLTHILCGNFLQKIVAVSYHVLQFVCSDFVLLPFILCRVLWWNVVFM